MAAGRETRPRGGAGGRPPPPRPGGGVRGRRDPWMVVGGRTFTGDLLARLGYANAFDNWGGRYPHTDVAEITAADVDLVVLPDEPYRFHAGDGPEAFPGLRCALVSGRLLTWYGPSLVEAARVLPGQLAAALVPLE